MALSDKEAKCCAIAFVNCFNSGYLQSDAADETTITWIDVFPDLSTIINYGENECIDCAQKCTGRTHSIPNKTKWNEHWNSAGNSIENESLGDFILFLKRMVNG